MKSIIYAVTKEKLEEIVKNAVSYSEILRNFGLENRGDNHKTLKRRLTEEGIDYSHVGKYSGGRKGSQNHTQRLSKEKCLELVFSLKENAIPSKKTKKYALVYNLIPHVCFVCKNAGEWHGQRLTLELDHINGNNCDDRLENLRFLCPNCHSQTPTFRGRNRKKIKLRLTDIDPEWRHRPRPHRRKVVRPEPPELEKLITEFSFTQIGQMFGVSGNAVKKWCRVAKIPLIIKHRKTVDRPRVELGTTL